MTPPEIVYSDGHLLVCIKPRGLLSQGGADDLAAALAEGGLSGFLEPAHRLDREAGGLIALARTPQAAAALARSLQAGAWCKQYLAVVRGQPEAPSGELRDLLFRDARKNRSYVVSRPRKGVREAVLQYQSFASAQGCTLVRVRLLTGRTHQIRVQFSSRALPLLGDGRYGGGGGALGLWSVLLALPHPVTREELRFCAPPPAEPPFDLFSREVCTMASEVV